MPDQEVTYNLKAVVRETGLNPETLRAWERRYGLPHPRRSPGGHRMYTHRDIHMLKWLVARQREGLAISHAVTQWRQLEASGQDPLWLFSQNAPDNNTGLESLRRSWIAACKDFSEQIAEQILSQALAIADPETVCLEILQKGLAEIGLQWYQGQISVQQEHFASALAIRRLHALIAATPAPIREGRILAACPPEEEHEFGLLLVTYLLRRRGMDVVYLGANVPFLRLEATLQTTSPFLIISLAQTLPSAATLRDMAVFLEQQGVLLGFGGGIFQISSRLKTYIHGHFLGEELPSIPEAVERIKRLPNPLAAVPSLPSEYQQVLSQYLDKQLQIEAAVYRIMRAEVSPDHLQQASLHFKRHLMAALSFGDIHLLSDSVQWLKGLLENSDFSPGLIERYVKAYHQAVEMHLADEGNVILAGLAELRFGENPILDG